MSRSSNSRRQFLKQGTTAAAAAALMPYWFSTQRTLADDAAKSPNERLRLGCIGTGDRWKQIFKGASNFFTTLAVCDVDANHAAEGLQNANDKNAKAGFQGQHVDVYEDYQKILDRPDIDAVTIVTPDHWHSKIAIEAMQAGKDVYCEKPLTLTINEGKQICKVARETGRVFQVGTQQRTEMGQRFVGAIAILRAGRIGEIKKVTCNIGGVSPCDPIPVAAVPEGLNWEKWQGQTPLKDFRFRESGRWGNTRCHYEFRWWYEYSGGKMTDWGAHHVDIASWALGMGDSGPKTVEGIMAQHPVPLQDGMPTEDDRYNVATKFDVQAMYPNGVEMHIVSDSPEGNGILFEGTDGSFHVSRGDMKDIVGTAVADVLGKKNPLPEDALEKVYGKKIPGSHMENFVNCIGDRSLPISDVFSHHRAMTTCHLANIAIRLGRKLNWDPVAEQIVGDEAANHWLGREQRKGYEINVTI
ncbi:MAG: Gfo/Idh/MocA family protein [Planctomycetaceae bacterium]